MQGEGGGRRVRDEVVVVEEEEEEVAEEDLLLGYSYWEDLSCTDKYSMWCGITKLNDCV